ncbi:NAD(P)/FAD-dependent oxidoreductase [Streptomyces violaceusniger]
MTLMEEHAMDRYYRALSLWHQSVPGLLEPRPPLDGDLQVDIAIVGAGFTGLWTAYYLLGADPSLRIAVLESQIAGFGASGRNGGWCSALFPVSAPALAKEYGHDAATAQYAAMRGAVSEVVAVAAAEGVDADIAHSGTVVLARSEPQLGRARMEAVEAEPFGLGLSLLDASQARSMVHAEGILGATFTPHCAAVNPAKLVRSLARVAEDRGALIFERTAATRIEPGRVRTGRGTVHADVVVQATEGYTPTLAGLRRTIAPVYSMVIATEPLPEATWERIGLAERQTFSDYRHMIIYGQRSVENRLVLGGRGAPYHFGSSTHPNHDHQAALHATLRHTMVELFPALHKAHITHQWGGPVGITRDWHASVGLTDGLAWAGGYVGDGVSTANLAGRTLTDLILNRQSDLTTLPWVGHHSPRWEPEPLRWLGIRAGTATMAFADAYENRTGRPSRLATLMAKLTGQ